MSSPEVSIALALGIPAAGILAWGNAPGTNQLVLTYDGDPGISSENITVAITPVPTEE